MTTMRTIPRLVMPPIIVSAVVVMAIRVAVVAPAQAWIDENENVTRENNGAEPTRRAINDIDGTIPVVCHLLMMKGIIVVDEKRMIKRKRRERRNIMTVAMAMRMMITRLLDDEVSLLARNSNFT